MGDNRLFETVYRENAILIYRYLLSIGCPMQDTEDIIQNTFVKALINIDSFRGDCKISVWLCRIAKNTWFDHLKKQKREIPQLPTETQFSENHYFEWLDLIQGLAEPYKTVFIKKALANQSYSELAEKYGKTESWARVTFHRARLQLQKMLNEQEEHYEK